jgi:hypothetical protein
MPVQYYLRFLIAVVVVQSEGLGPTNYLPRWYPFALPPTTQLPTSLQPPRQM